MFPSYMKPATAKYRKTNGKRVSVFAAPSAVVVTVGSRAAAVAKGTRKENACRRNKPIGFVVMLLFLLKKYGPD